MVNVIKVTLWNKKLGALHWDDSKKYASFEYFPDFLKAGLNVSPIHLPVENAENRIFSFPSLNEETFKGLPGMLSDVLPDDFGNQMINEYLRINNINKASFNPLDRLLYIGKRGMGALEFEPPTHLKGRESTPLEIGRLVSLARRVLTDRQNFSLTIEETDVFNELIKVGTSAGGQRAKAIIAYNHNTGEVLSGQTDCPKGFDHYLLKFDGVNAKILGDPEGYGKIEYAYYLMATECGIKMMDSQLLEEGERAHFMTKRFDRIDNKKLHMQTLCSLAHFDYKAPGQYGYEDAFQVMRTLKLSHTDAIQLFKRMVFNVIARNQDDHTKNISFLMDTTGRWSLSPAYDVTYSYNPHGIWTSSHQMSINGKRDHITRDDLLAVAASISYKSAKENIERIREVVKKWMFFAEKANIPQEQAQKIQRAFRLSV